MNEMTQADYILDHSQMEMRRLMSQAVILRPITEGLLRVAEIGPGMRWRGSYFGLHTKDSVLRTSS
jgi:hypothetical protein